MKKYLFMAVAGMLALSSCSNDSDELVVKDVPQTMTFTAGFADDEASRAAIGSDRSVTWESSDGIMVFSTKNSSGVNFSLSSGEGSNSATFTGEAVNNDSKFYAVYPAMGSSLVGTTIKDLGIQPVQINPAWFNNFSVETSGLDKTSAFAVAVADYDQALQFECICAILKVTLNPGSSGCSNTSVTVSADEDLADQFDYDTATGTITRKTTGNSNSVQVNGVCVKGTRTLYLKVLPDTYHNFKLLVESNNHTKFADKTKTDPVTFEAGKVYDLGTYECSE